MTKQIFSCQSCNNYNTVNKYDWNKHLHTKKHLKNTTINTTQTTNVFICECGKLYKYISGLSRHKRTCQPNKQQEQINSLHTLLEKTIESQQMTLNKLHRMCYQEMAKVLLEYLWWQYLTLDIFFGQNLKYLLHMNSFCYYKIHLKTLLSHNLAPKL